MPTTTAETPSIDELSDLIRHALTIRGYSHDYVSGYIAAQKIDGCLRPLIQPWQRRSAGNRFRLVIETAPSKKIAPGGYAPPDPA